MMPRGASLSDACRSRNSRRESHLNFFFHAGIFFSRTFSVLECYGESGLFFFGDYFLFRENIYILFSFVSFMS